MNKDDIYYGQSNSESLSESADSVVEDILDEATDNSGESFDVIAERIDWPIRVYEYKRMPIDGDRLDKSIATNILYSILDDLDSDYGNPDGRTEATSKMKEASHTFCKVILEEYVPWQCEKTGKVFEYTREQIEREEKTNR